ncbi:MAG: Gfo/Idh/MocA family protein [Aristaeellaceae bacterium]
MTEPFRFAILGAGSIAGKFCRAVELTEGCRVCAVASKSLERAQAFAQRNHIDRFYDSYEALLEQEKPDCAYIAVTPNDHHRLTMLCIRHGVPVLCEKAMFQDSREAQEAFDAAARAKVFVMEAMWSRYLPALRRVRQWLEAGAIGDVVMSQCGIGFAAPEDPENRYFNPRLGGGAARDVTVYAYELTTWLIRQDIRRMSVSAVWSDTGVDVSNHIAIDFETALADLATSFVTRMEERMVIYGRKGKIVIPKPHVASEAFLYDAAGEVAEHFTDTQTRNGFTWEIGDVMRCVREGRLESDTVPWADTLDCARLFDRIDETRR